MCAYGPSQEACAATRTKTGKDCFRGSMTCQHLDLISSLQKCEAINFCRLKPPGFGTVLQQPQETDSRGGADPTQCLSHSGWRPSRQASHYLPVLQTPTVYLPRAKALGRFLPPCFGTCWLLYLNSLLPLPPASPVCLSQSLGPPSFLPRLPGHDCLPPPVPCGPHRVL